LVRGNPTLTSPLMREYQFLLSPGPSCISPTGAPRISRITNSREKPTPYLHHTAPVSFAICLME
jgi:hypothetical protein